MKRGNSWKSHLQLRPTGPANSSTPPTASTATKYELCAMTSKTRTATAAPTITHYHTYSNNFSYWTRYRNLSTPPITSTVTIWLLQLPQPNKLHEQHESLACERPALGCLLLVDHRQTETAVLLDSAEAARRVWTLWVYVWYVMRGINIQGSAQDVFHYELMWKIRNTLRVFVST